MAEEDIYNSKRHFERFVATYRDFGKPPTPANPARDGGKRVRIYYCRNAENLKYFPKLFAWLEVKDLSYVRRLRVCSMLKFVCHVSDKDLAHCDRDDINAMVAAANQTFTSDKTKHDFIVSLRFLWKILLPERDERGRIDDYVVPYPVRHLSARMDKSRQKRRLDTLSIDEYERLIKSFSQDARMQAYIALEFESLGRPQEILYTKIRDVELLDNYAKVWISEHGKEGTGFLQCIDGFPYIARWLNEHPLRHDTNAFFFVNLGNTGRYKQMNPNTINKHLREHCERLGISKRITCYSLKRSGVTFRRIRGDSDATIQHTARWTSTRQLKAYDYSNQDDILKKELARRGLIADKKYLDFRPVTKKCAFCDHINGIGNDACENCKRPLDREQIVKEIARKENEVEALRAQLKEFPAMIAELVEQRAKELLYAERHLKNR